jgi:hypothetical protein
MRSKVCAWLAAAVLLGSGAFGVAGCDMGAAQCSQCQVTLTIVFKVGVQRQSAERAVASCLAKSLSVEVSRWLITRHPPGALPEGQHGPHLVALAYPHSDQISKLNKALGCLSSPVILDAGSGVIDSG